MELLKTHCSRSSKLVSFLSNTALSGGVLLLRVLAHLRLTVFTRWKTELAYGDSLESGRPLGMTPETPLFWELLA